LIPVVEGMKIKAEKLTSVEIEMQKQIRYEE
jgi:hypothetical protein